MLEAMKAFVNSDIFEAHDTDISSTEGYTRFNTKALDNWLVSHQYHYNSCKQLFPLLRALGIITTRHQSSYYFAISATPEPKQSWQHLDLKDNFTQLVSPC